MARPRSPGAPSRAGAAGAIVPDLPLEEAGEVREALAAEGLDLVPLLAPTTPPERRARICAAARGFVYVVSTVGTTGERQELPPGLSELVAAAKADAEVPVAVGFGIGTPAQVAEVSGIADGVIVGSRLVRAAGEAGSPEAAAAAVGASCANRAKLRGNPGRGGTSCTFSSTARGDSPTANLRKS